MAETISPSQAAPTDLYLERLALETQDRKERYTLLVGDLDQHDMASLHAALGGDSEGEGDWQNKNSDDPAALSVGRRLALAYAEPPLAPPDVLTTDASNITRLRTAPPMKRTPLAPQKWSTNPFVNIGRRFKRWANGDFRKRRRESPSASWKWVARRRRWILLVLIFGQSIIAANQMRTVLPGQGLQWLEVTILSLFVLLFAWVSAGFWTALMGFFQLLRSHDRYAIDSEVGDEPIDDEARTALLVPICNEDVARVFAGVRATLESLRSTGNDRHFDIFILSDTSDPDIAIQETYAWLGLCRDLNAFGQVYYRRRQRRVKRKSGNLDDFCRRWGALYRYMVVLDADSVMSGKCLTRLVQMMEVHSRVGIIQTAPRASGRLNLYARMQQFATRVYGPLFTAGLHFWQLGESHYWGHNAIIRLAPFMQHCILAPLPGKGSMSGEILSHDFVEAALMRRAGWGVWIAYKLEGSYEEMPPNLLDELNRDRRWCHGNLMNFRLFFSQGIHPVHRAVFLTGLMSYLSAPLWCLFLVLSTALLAVHSFSTPDYFPEPGMLFPVWPQWNPTLAVGLFGVTALLLFLPKLLSVLLVWIKGSRQYGGPLKVLASMVLESLFSMLLAPVRMLFHTRFVLTSVMGWAVQWRSPSRENSDTTWGDAIRAHWTQTLIGAVWAAGVYVMEPTFLWWLSPIVVALMLSIPVSALSSRVSLGQLSFQKRLFRIPEETQPPRVLRRMVSLLAQMNTGMSAPSFVRVVVEPVPNALATALGTSRHTDVEPIRQRRAERVSRAVLMGPAGMSRLERLDFLDDPVMMSQLHYHLWVDSKAHHSWFELGLPGRESTHLPTFS
ncbi:glucans biosynthesis glucosyltransferase MdoH [Halomonas sp. HAL1]|uniref:glucans biosynthesis glucosyltransferase MdoH n=1 Tax=Halomonas sp. HAL1 TaxID=550984 RepID=UPI00022D2BE8|nr:glucans biosynthesis glucosyltransferase MdoH [Halomonas sp. HAL1]EHA13776.1 glucosyltransferase MdoH [Halomonas sp. HAL1]WKV93572.1 glucans biosynthesis glucosyltransferase MdoH [Halomonas sp. HAL1]